MQRIEEAATRTPRKISIVLPNTEREKSGKTHGSRHHYDCPDKRLVDEMSVSSYVIGHNRRFGGDNVTPQIWNDLGPHLSFKSSKEKCTTPSGWHVGGFLRMMAEDVKGPWLELQADEDTFSIDSSEAETQTEARHTKRSISNRTTCSRSFSRSNTSGCAMGSTTLTPFPFVSYRRPRVAVRKQIISYADVPLLRRQLGSLRAEREGTKLRRDFARTTNDIFRMRLNRVDDLDYNRQRHFRNMCVTYLGTSPGASRALAGQLSTPL